MPSKATSSFPLQELNGHHKRVNTDNEQNEKRNYYKPAIQHELWKLLLGDLFDLDASIAVAKALSMESDVSRGILDIGSGTGRWALDISRRYPYAKVTGIDLAPERPKYAPSSCKFEVVDVTDDSTTVPLNDKTFDLVHTRSVLGYTKEPTKVVSKVADWLRPGGVYILADGDFIILDENKIPIQRANLNNTPDEVDSRVSWFACLLSEISRITGAENSLPGTNIESWLKQNDLFENIQVRSYLLPVGWSGKEEDGIYDGPQLGKVARKNLVEYIVSVEPLLSTHLNADQVENLVKKSKDEISDPAGHIYLQFTTAWTCRK